MTPPSAIPFRSAGTSERVEALDGASVSVTSRGLGWQGLVVEAGTNPSWDVTDVAVDGHYVAVNAAPDPLVMEVRIARSFVRSVLPPGSLWLHPAGEGFSVRVPGPCSYASVVLDAERMAGALSARRVDLEPRIAVRDDQLAHVVGALVAETRGGGRLGLLYADSLFAAIATHVALRHGSLQGQAAPAAVPAAALRRALDYIDANLGRELRVDQLARVAGAAARSFARAFKRRTGETPYAYVLRRRLERARDAVVAGDEPIFAIAARLGFADQAHLTRLFRRRFGAPPGALRRGGR